MQGPRGELVFMGEVPQPFERCSVGGGHQEAAGVDDEVEVLLQVRSEVHLYQVEGLVCRCVGVWVCVCVRESVRESV